MNRRDAVFDGEIAEENRLLRVGTTPAELTAGDQSTDLIPPADGTISRAFFSSLLANIGRKRTSPALQGENL